MVRVHGEGLRKLERGTAVVYRKWVKPEGPLRAGGLVEARDPGGEPVACALWEPSGPVALRVVSHGPCEWRDPRDAVSYRLEQALASRRVYGLDRLGSFRLVNSDGDLLSGLVVDVYSDVAVVQSSSAAIDALLGHVAGELRRLVGVGHVYNKSTQRSRRDIGLEPVAGWLAGGRERVTIEEGGARFIVDVVRGQKTGFFLDQRPNRLELYKLPLEGGRVLDVFSYTGAFGIHAYLAGAREVVFLEEDPVALEILRENLKLNGVERYRIIAGSVWRSMDRVEPGSFTLAIVDPPAFIQERSQLERGMRAYTAVYRWASTRVREGGLIYLSSCSYFLKRDLFLGVVNYALTREGWDYSILGSLRGAGPDHVFRGEEYLDYLKGAFIHLRRRGPARAG
ncbi:class I SAM-dependent rRNA methyltransferase [Stetteria hydrogenophila]